MTSQTPPCFDSTQVVLLLLSNHKSTAHDPVGLRPTYLSSLVRRNYFDCFVFILEGLQEFHYLGIISLLLQSWVIMRMRKLILHFLVQKAGK